MKFLINNLSILNIHGIPIQEIVALYFDLRPLARIGVSFQQLKVLKELCPGLGLKLLTIESYGPNKNHPLLLISKSEKKLKAHYTLEKKYAGDPILGKHLGYPTCCIEKFKKNKKFRKNKLILIKTLLDTKGKLNFHLNYFYNFESRKFNYEEFNRISSSYRLRNMYLIPHTPCSFNCRNSVEYAEKLSNILKLYLPKYYGKMIFFLKKPILYFSNFVFFPLIGKMNNNSLTYHSFIKIHDNLPIRIVELLERGNLIKEEDNFIKIFKNSHYIDTLPLGIKLFNFE